MDQPGTDLVEEGVRWSSGTLPTGSGSGRPLAATPSNRPSPPSPSAAPPPEPTSYDTLAQQALAGAGLGQLTRLLAAHLGRPVLVENRFFQPLAQAYPGPVDDRLPLPTTVDHLAPAETRQIWYQLQQNPDVLRLAASPAYPRRGATPPRPARPARLIVPIQLGRSTVGYLSVVEAGQPLADIDPRLVRQAALALGIEFVRQRAAFEVECRLKGDLLDAVLRSAELPAEGRALRAALLAYDITAPQTLLVAAIDPPRDRPETAPDVTLPAVADLVEVLGPWAQQTFADSLIAARDDVLLILLAGLHPDGLPAPPAAPNRSRGAADPPLDPTSARLAAALRRAVVQQIPGLSLSIAVAPAIEDWRDLRRTYHVACRALTTLKLLGEHGQTIATTDPRLAIFFLLDGAHPHHLREFVDLVLGPLIAYDEQHGRVLLLTLEAYLAQGGQWETTARALSIHTSTLKYRVQRIAEVGGLDLRNPDHRFNAALALRLRTLTLSTTGE
jgi:hypothetical protein